MIDQGSPVRPGDVVRIRAERWRVAARLAFGASSFIDVAGLDAGNRGRRARFVLPFEPIEFLPSSDAPRVVRRTRWRHVARQALADALPSPACLRTAARADFTILPFQLEPALAVTHGRGSRLLIADAVGLGKTIQASLIVAEVLARTRDGHALVLCPAGLREQWQEELRGRFGLRTAVLDSAALAAGTTVTTAGANPWAAHEVAIASIDYVKRPEVMRGLEDVVWDGVVFDEAHSLSGSSDRSAAASALAARARVVVLLTATPHSGHDDAFLRMCDIGRLRDDAPLLFFRRTRAAAGMVDSRRVHRLPVVPTHSERRMHAALRDYTVAVLRERTEASHAAALAMIVLARRACSSPSSLARSVERRLNLLFEGETDRGGQLDLPFADLPADDEEPVAELATPGLADGGEERSRLQRVLALARAASADESKLHRLRRLLRAARQPAIVFTEYRDTLSRVAAALSDIDCVLLHGAMSLSERRDAARRFTSGGAQVLLATDAASEGLNLHQRCRLVINLELPWTPLRLEQRVGRVDRIGQQRRVHAIHFVGRGTSEQRLSDRLISLERQAQSSLHEMAAFDAEQIGRAVIGGEALPTVARGDDGEPHGATSAISDAAITEARRISIARDLLRKGKRIDEPRPAVTLLRSHSCGPSAYWLWRLHVESAHGEWLWDAYTPLAMTAHRSGTRTPDGIRRLLAAHATDVDACVQEAQRRAVEQFAESTRIPLALAASRERAIGDGIAAQRGALAAALGQRSLFDRRAERQVGARAAVLDSAFARCTERLDEIARCAEPTAGPRQLAFAIVLG